MSRRRSADRSNSLSRVHIHWIRKVFTRRHGRYLRVLIYARYSTDEQRHRSITAQIEYCQRVLQALGIDHVKITVIHDEKLSGELRSRPGIDQVKAGIVAGEWDVILVEDSSRLFRDEVACLELVRMAFDAEIRVICINDFVDTADEAWEERLKDAARHHASSNRYTSLRIKRALEELWCAQAAIGMPKPGYRRNSTRPATPDEPAEGPFFDEVDPRWVPVIKDAYERIAAGELPVSVAQQLTKAGLPKVSNSRSPVWTAKNVVALIQRLDYRGVQTYRDRVSKKVYATGRHRLRPNDPDEVLTRDMPHLRMVEDDLWHAANAAIESRTKGNVPQGRDSRLFGVPRLSRGPLSSILFCPCGGTMWAGAGATGKRTYCCSRSRRGGTCWNKATALLDRTHQNLADAIIPVLESPGSWLEDLLQEVGNLSDDHGQREARVAELQAKIAQLEKRQQHLAEAISQASRPLEVLVAKMEKFADRLESHRAKVARLQQRGALCAPPTRQEVEERLGEIIAAIRPMDRGSRDELRQLVGRIKAIPFQQFGSNKVVLRARFQLRLTAILPARVRAALKTLCEGSVDERFRIPMLVDLFEPSTGPQYGMEALRLNAQEGCGLTAIGKRLGITKRKANLAVQYGRDLRAADRTDPFTELTEAPAAASRWRTRQGPPEQEA